MSKIIQLGEVTRDLPIFGNVFLGVAEKGTDIVRNLGKYFLDMPIDKFDNEYITGKGSGITLTNNEIKDVKEVIKFLENRGIFLKGTTRKITSQERGILNFLEPLMRAGLPLMKSLLTPLAVTIWIISRNDSNRCSYSK